MAWTGTGRRIVVLATLCAMLGGAGCASRSGAPGARAPEASQSYRGAPEALATCLRDRVLGQDECREHFQKAEVAVEADGKGAVFTCTNYTDATGAGMAVGAGLGPAGILTGLLIGSLMDAASDPAGTKIYSARLREADSGQSRAEFWVSRPRAGADKSLARMTSLLSVCESVLVALPSTGGSAPAGTALSAAAEAKAPAAP